MTAAGTPPAIGEALAALSALPPAVQLATALRRLRGARRGPLARFAVGSELAGVRGSEKRIDGRLLEAVSARALSETSGAVFTPAPEARILAAFALAEAASRRGGPAAPRSLAMLLGMERPGGGLRSALEGLRVVDPACGGGALLVAAESLARRVGARLLLHGIDLAPLAARACRTRLALLGARARVEAGDALRSRWPAADLVLANPPFLRHEAIPAGRKARAVRRSGLSAQADLSAHFAALSIRRAPVAALVWPRALFTSRSAAPLLAEARARGGFSLLLRSRAAGSFAASVDTFLAVWAEGGADRSAAEAGVPLGDLAAEELLALSRRRSGPRLRLLGRHAPEAGGAVRVDAVCAVRFGVKSGCNAFFHLSPLGGGRYRSALAGEVDLADSDVSPLLASLKEARAPERAEPVRVIFRPERDSATARAYAALGEALGVHRRPTCAGRTPWWRLAPGRGPAPVLYPAKVGARAFAFLNRTGLIEDKKWHALFPEGVEAWLLALVLSSTPVRLAIDRAARQLTGAQAIADVDCRVLASAPFPVPLALRPLQRQLEECRAALADDPVTTDLAAMLDRPAQRELDGLAGLALGLTLSDVERGRREMLERVRSRLEHAASVRAAVAGAG